MAQPDNIENGQIPDASKLMTWFNWLNAGKGIQKETFENLISSAQANPQDSFLCWATDLKQLMFYTGDDAIGQSGFIAIGGE